MEDEGLVEDEFITETAWQYFGCYGEGCLPLLERLAEAAERTGEVVQAQTWRAIAEAAEAILYGFDAVRESPFPRGLV